MAFVTDRIGNRRKSKRMGMLWASWILLPARRRGASDVVLPV